MCDRRHGHTRGLELASMADVKRQQQDQVSATFNMFNSIVAIAVIVSLLGASSTRWPCPYPAHSARSRRSCPRAVRRG
jgi:hypothetical protein